MDKVKYAARWLADRFSLARALMAIVVLTLAFAIYAHIVSQTIGEEYKLRVMQPQDFKPVMPRE